MYTNGEEINMWSFDSTDEQQIFKETVRKYFEREVAPLVEEAEETEVFPVECVERPVIGDRVLGAE